MASKDGRVEAGYVKEEGHHIFVLGLEEVGHLSCDADLVLASKLETLSLVCDLHEEPYALFLWRSVRFNHFDEAVDLRGQGVDRGREDGVKLAKISELAGDICGEGIERLCIF